MAHLIFQKKFPLLIRQIPAFSTALHEFLSMIGSLKGLCLRPAGRNHLMGAVKHKPRNLLYGKPGCQVLCPFLCGKSPVLIGRQLTRSQKILKCQPVLRDQLDPGIFSQPQILSARIMNNDISVL